MTKSSHWKTTLTVMLLAVPFMAGALCLQAASASPAMLQTGGDGKVTAPGATPSVAELAVKGGYFMIPIFACSLVLLTFGLERYFVLRREARQERALIAAMRERIGNGGLTKENGMVLCESHPGSIANMLKAGLEKAGRPSADIEKIVSHVGDLEVTRLKQNLRPINVTVALAPLLGLIGTIQGMIQAFMVVATEKGAIGKTEKLADGIYTALVTTFAGLCVAIPGIILYYYFIARIERMVAETNEFLDPFVESLAESREVAVK